MPIFKAAHCLHDVSREVCVFGGGGQGCSMDQTTSEAAVVAVTGLQQHHEHPSISSFLKWQHQRWQLHGQAVCHSVLHCSKWIYAAVNVCLLVVSRLMHRRVQHDSSSWEAALGGQPVQLPACLPASWLATNLVSSPR